MTCTEWIVVLLFFVIIGCSFPQNEPNHETQIDESIVLSENPCNIETDTVTNNLIEFKKLDYNWISSNFKGYVHKSGYKSNCYGEYFSFHRDNEQFGKISFIPTDSKTTISPICATIIVSYIKTPWMYNSDDHVLHALTVSEKLPFPIPYNIGIGVNKKTVDNLFGEPTKEIDSIYYYRYDTILLAIKYYENEIDVFSIGFYNNNCKLETLHEDIINEFNSIVSHRISIPNEVVYQMIDFNR